jgi:quercetin dioxygenase-like cupin family protein
MYDGRVYHTVTKMMIAMLTIAELPQKEVKQGFKARFVHTERNTLGFWEVEKGAVLPMHSHYHEQVTQVLEGQFEMTIGEVTHVYQPGELAVIPPNVPHGGLALTDCKIFDIFSPVRDDYKTE